VSQHSLTHFIVPALANRSTGAAHRRRQAIRRQSVGADSCPHPGDPLLNERSAGSDSVLRHWCGCGPTQHAFVVGDRVARADGRGDGALDDDRRGLLRVREPASGAVSASRRRVVVSHVGVLPDLHVDHNSRSWCTPRLTRMHDTPAPHGGEPTVSSLDSYRSRLVSRHPHSGLYSHALLSTRPCVSAWRTPWLCRMRYKPGEPHQERCLHVQGNGRSSQ
jgi:hypothetical protein